jgi:hypothetical protein
MNKIQVTKNMQASIGAFPNTTAIRRYFGWGKTRTAEFLSTLECITDGKSKQYFVGDIAEKLYRERSF